MCTNFQGRWEDRRHIDPLSAAYGRGSGLPAAVRSSWACLDYWMFLLQGMVYFWHGKVIATKCTLAEVRDPLLGSVPAAGHPTMML